MNNNQGTGLVLSKMNRTDEDITNEEVYM